MDSRPVAEASPSRAVTVTRSSPSTSRSSVTVKLNLPRAALWPAGMVTLKLGTAVKSAPARAFPGCDGQLTRPASSSSWHAPSVAPATPNATVKGAAERKPSAKETVKATSVVPDPSATVASSNSNSTTGEASESVMVNSPLETDRGI